MTAFPRRPLAAVLALPAFALAACTGAAGPQTLDTIDVASTVAIVETQKASGTVASGDDSAKVETSYLVVDSSGRTSTVTKTGLSDTKEGSAASMQGVVMDWNEDSLFLSDGAGLRWLRPGGKEGAALEDATEPGLVERAYPLEDSATRVLLGHDANMDGSAFAVARESGVGSGKATGEYLGGAVCGNDAYIVAGNLSATSLEDSGVRAPMTLRKVVEAGEPANAEIGFHDSILDFSRPLDGALACDGEDIVMIVEHSAQDGMPYARTGEPGEPVDFEVGDYVVETDYDDRLLVTLERWNTTTGERTVRPVASGVEPAVKVHEVMMGSRADAPALQNGGLYWVDGLGRVMRTDVRTGQTEAVSQSLQTTSKLEELDSFQVDMHEGVVDILVDSTRDRASDRIVRVDLATGKETRTIGLKNLGALAGDDASVFVTALATNPKR